MDINECRLMWMNVNEGNASMIAKQFFFLNGIHLCWDRNHSCRFDHHGYHLSNFKPRSFSFITHMKI
jgi:hypothetical protein